MMKLYCRVKKRIAMKHIPWPDKLKHGLKLRAGDLVSTCKGYNERIAEITPHWTNRVGVGVNLLTDTRLRRGRFITDFDIHTESGSSCSLLHCCTFPLETREQIIAYFLGWDAPEWREWRKKSGWGDTYLESIIDGIKSGKEVFDENGQPLYDYCVDYERKARFPERWAQESK